MHVTVEIVSSVHLGVGGDPLDLELNEDSTVKDLLTVLVSLGEKVASRLVCQDGEPFVSFVVNGEHAELDCLLAPDDRVVILPPIGGG
jgi:molybdopterin converting factor small subunit